MKNNVTHLKNNPILHERYRNIWHAYLSLSSEVGNYPRDKSNLPNQERKIWEDMSAALNGYIYESTH